MRPPTRPPLGFQPIPSEFRGPLHGLSWIGTLAWCICASKGATETPGNLWLSGELPILGLSENRRNERQWLKTYFFVPILRCNFGWYTTFSDKAKVMFLFKMNVISTRMDNHGKITSNDLKNICRVWLNPGMHRFPTGGLEYGAAKTDGQLPTRRCVAESCRRWIFLSAQGWCRATSGDFVGWCDVNRTACEARANHHWIALFILENTASNHLRRLKLFWFGDITTEGSFVTGNLTISLELRPELSFLTSDLQLHEVTAVNDSQLTYNTIYAMQCYPIVMQLQRAGERGPICGKSLYICFVINIRRQLYYGTSE